MRGWTSKIAAALILIGAAVFVSWLLLKNAFDSPGPLAEATAVVVPKGAGVAQIAALLDEAGVIDGRLVFQAGVRLSGGTLRAGEYMFPASISPKGAAEMMRKGEVLVRRLTIPEGLTSRQIAALLNEAEELSGVASPPPEGTLLPETYHYSRDDSRGALITRMEGDMRQVVDIAWEKRAPDLPLKSKAEAVVLASIVERETGVAAERPRVAAVFLNRLRLGMRLQSDPTVIYGLSDGMGVLDRSLTRDDLLKPTAFNTYVIAALPPAPIANPGRASIEAVLNPAKTDDLYFVADGTGGHVFARTLDEHNHNVAKWRQVEKERRGR